MEKKFDVIKRMVSKCLRYCLLMGIASFCIFYFFGKNIGTLVFKNPSSGELLTLFSFLCPFVYASSVLSSTLNGMGKMRSVLIHNLLSVGVRMMFIVAFVPKVGIKGYLFGAVAANVLLLVLHGIRILRICSCSKG